MRRAKRACYALPSCNAMARLPSRGPFVAGEGRAVERGLTATFTPLTSGPCAAPTHPRHLCRHPCRRRLLRCFTPRASAVAPRLPTWEPRFVLCMNAWQERCRRMAAVTRSCGLRNTTTTGGAVAARAMGPTGAAPTVTGRYGRAPTVTGRVGQRGSMRHPCHPRL